MSNQASKLVKPLTANDVVRAQPKVAAADVAPALRVVPLKIAPLLAPYRRHGRLSLRIERMPQLARLSAGRNNGNGSWSLGGDELDELTYMVPETAGEHSLAIRVISVDRSAGNTVAVLDYLVSLEGAVPGPAGGDAPAAVVAVAAPDGAALQRFHDELAAAKAILVARESELDATRRRAELAEIELTKRRADAEIAVAQADWKAELDERLGAAVTQASLDLQQHRKTWEAEQAERTAKLEERALERLLEARERWQKEQEGRLAAADAAWEEKLTKAQSEARAEMRAAGRGKVDEAELRVRDDKLAALKSKLVEQDAALVSAQEKFKEERERWGQQAEAALRKAEQLWRAKETERLATADAAWEERLAKAHSEARAEARAAGRGKVDEAELHARDDKLAALKSKLAEQDAALVTVQAKFEEEHERWGQQAEAALRKAELLWRTKETERLAAVETSWQQKLAAAREEARGAPNDDEPRRLREELSALTRTLAERDADLTHAREEMEAARKNAAHAATDRDEIRALKTVLAERDAALTQAQTAARKPQPGANENEPRRLREELGALTRRLAERDADLAQLREDLEAARKKTAPAATDRDEIRALKTVLAERDAALTQAQTAVREARKSQPNAIEDALAEAESRWKADEAVRITAIETQWREYFESALAEATHKYETAEQALEQLRLETETTHYNAAAQADSSAQRASGAPYPARMIVLRPNSTWQADERNEAPRPASPPRLVRDVLIAAALGALAIFLYPRVESYLPPALRLPSSALPNSPAVETTPAPAVETSPVPADVATPVPAPQHRAIALKEANVRATPSTSAAIVSRLPRGMSVPLGERRGDWVMVRIEDKNGKTAPIDGWVHSSMLKADGAAATD